MRPLRPSKYRLTPEGGVEFSEIEIRMADKLKALELLGRYLGMFRDSVGIDRRRGGGHQL
jgi:hypothetical protein